MIGPRMDPNRILATTAPPAPPEPRPEDFEDIDGYWDALLEWHHVHASWVAHAARKRLTDAELAAELHAAALAVYRAKVHREGRAHDAALGWFLTITRFANGADQAPSYRAEDYA